MNATRSTQHSLSPVDLPPEPADREIPFAAEGETFQHYQVLRREDGSLWELGRGAMGVTYKAFDTNLRCHVALKVISAHYLHSEMAGQRFIREARIAARVRHPNIAAVHHLGTDPQGFFYAMEFIDGETLENLVERIGALPLETVLRIGLQVARALAAASRQGLIHRDIKPANLMVIQQDGTGDDPLFVKMIDFGLARSYGGDDSHPQLTATGFVGTPLYASPEQLEEKDLDVRSDIYSLGVTLWILLTGQPPFTGKMTQVITQHLHAPPPWWQLGECSEPVRGLLERMLHKNRLQRYQTANELCLAIESCLRCVTGKEALPAENQGQVSPVTVKIGAQPGGATAGGVPAPRLPGTLASSLRMTMKSLIGLNGQTNKVSGGRWSARLKTPWIGVAAVALCIGGFVYWPRPADTARPASSVAPKVVPTVAAATPPPAPVPTEPASPSADKTTAAAPAPSPSLPEKSFPPSEAPISVSTPSDPRQGEPATQPMAVASPAPDSLASLDGSPVNPPEGAASPTPAPSPTAEDTQDKADDGGANAPAKNQSNVARSSHTRRGSKAAPTPAPNLFQRLFGIKPKSKSK